MSLQPDPPSRSIFHVRTLLIVSIILQGLLATAAHAQDAAPVSADEHILATVTTAPPCAACDRQATLIAERSTARALQSRPPTQTGTASAVALAQTPDLACDTCADNIRRLTLAAPQPVVHAVLFWMDTCGHCHYILEEVLPPLQDKYGDQLDISLIEVQSAEDTDRLYQTAEAFGVAKEDVGVPPLIIGDRALIGSSQIPAELPGLIEQYQAQGGVDFPDLPYTLDPTVTPAPNKTFIYLFWGDGCPHCEAAKPVLREMAQRYPNVEIREYEVWYQPENHELFVKMAAAFSFEPHVVPTIFLGGNYWEGFSEQDKADMESMLAVCAQAGCPDAGLGIVPAPTLPEARPDSEQPPGDVETTPTQTLPVSPAGMRDNGFVLAIAVMIGMAGTLVYTGVRVARGVRKDRPSPLSETVEKWRNLVFLVLCLIGLGVAGYLAYVEIRMVEATCGPVGDCNAVQASAYRGCLACCRWACWAYLATWQSWPPGVGAACATTGWPNWLLQPFSVWRCWAHCSRST